MRASIRARTVALRVVGSTRASIATIRAAIGAASSIPVTISTRDRPREGRGHPLGHREVDVRRVGDALQRGQLGALVEVLAGVHVRDADAGPERRADGLPGDDRLGARDLRQRDVTLGTRLVHLLLRDGLVLLQPLRRSSVVCASAASASCAFSSASSTETSSATSTVPASTIWPGVSATRRTVPAARCAA